VEILERDTFWHVAYCRALVAFHIEPQKVSFAHQRRRQRIFHQQQQSHWQLSHYSKSQSVSDHLEEMLEALNVQCDNLIAERLG
jgi:hypothetical protein